MCITYFQMEQINISQIKFIQIIFLLPPSYNRSVQLVCSHSVRYNLLNKANKKYHSQHPSVKGGKSKGEWTAHPSAWSTTAEFAFLNGPFHQQQKQIPMGIKHETSTVMQHNANNINKDGSDSKTNISLDPDALTSPRQKASGHTSLPSPLAAIKTSPSTIK